MHQYLFFLCYRCRRPYFAGGYECQEAGAVFDAKELVCAGCQPKAENVKECSKHGTEWIAFKCRYCCQFANFFCWSKCHFCNDCHKPGKWVELTTMTTGENKKKIWEYPQCEGLKVGVAKVQNDSSLSDAQKLDALLKLRSDPKTCPLGYRHPPNGFEFGLGCSMCADKDSEDENKHAEEKAKKDAEEKKQKAIADFRASLRTGRLCRHMSDFDTNGVFHTIGTVGGKEKWVNPAESGWIKVTSSSLSPISRPLTALTARETVRIFTDNKSGSWIAVDLLDKVLVVSHYTVRFSESYWNETPRGWVFEASADGTKWDALKTHTNEAKTLSRSPVATFPLPSRATRFRYFRITNQQRNSNNSSHLCLSGLELYGTLYST